MGMPKDKIEFYSKRDQEMIALRLEGLSYPQIAKRYGVDQGGVRRVLKRALKRGQITAEQMRITSTFGKPAIAPLSKETYDRRCIKRILNRIAINESGCWIWQGTKNGKGYGLTNYRNGSSHVHRLLYKLLNNVELSEEQFVLHKCDNPPCCNPAHLFLGNNDINMADKTAKGRHHELRVTHCPRGHAYAGDNLRINPNGSRACKTCQTARGRLLAGWPEELAYSAVKVKPGYSLVGGNWKDRRKSSKDARETTA